jgi:hypothetical protein
MTTEWLPTGHRPPLPRIETRPVYTPAPIDALPGDVRQQIENIERIARIKEGERVWQQVVETARST